jgi:carbon storage regulator
MTSCRLSKRRAVSRMLALSRKKDEAIIINEDIEIKIIEVKGDQVKIGISAPKSVPIYRKEVFLQIQEANKEAANSVDANQLNNLFKK